MARCSNRRRNKTERCSSNSRAISWHASARNSRSSWSSTARLRHRLQFKSANEASPLQRARPSSRVPGGWCFEQCCLHHEPSPNIRTEARNAAQVIGSTKEQLQAWLRDPSCVGRRKCQRGPSGIGAARNAHQVERIESVPKVKLLKFPPQKFDLFHARGAVPAAGRG